MLKDIIKIELEYPQIKGNKNKVQVGLIDVRAADDILIEYDFDRDGWVVKQASIFEWSIEDNVSDPDWKEVAFIPAWSRYQK